MNMKQLLRITLLLIVTGAVIFGIGYALHQQNEGSTVMENQSYALSEISRIQLLTDSPNVVIKPVTGEQINLTWREDDYVAYQAQVKGGELSVDYRTNTSWLKSLFGALLNRNEYTLEVELPEGYAGGLDIQTASGAITVHNALAAEEISLTSISGTIDANGIDSKGVVAIHSTSGGVDADSVRAAEDIRVKTVSGSVALRNAAALGGVEIITTSGSITMSGLSAENGIKIGTTSGAMNVSQARCGADVTINSISGSFRASGVDCEGFLAKSVSGGIDTLSLNADRIEMKSTSGTISGTLGGTRGDYGIQVHTVSGNSNLQNSDEGKGKTLTVSTVSGGIDIRFSGVTGQ